MQITGSQSATSAPHTPRRVRFSYTRFAMAMGKSG